MRRFVTDLFFAAATVTVSAQPGPARAEWGAPDVAVAQAGGKWTIVGHRQTTFADGTTATVGWDQSSAQVAPPLQ